MKHLICCLLLCILLLSACSSQNPATEQTTLLRTEESTEEITTEAPEETTAAPVPERDVSALARSLGITGFTYPRMDGSTSTLAIVQNIWRQMIGHEAVAPAVSFPTTASKTVPSYRKLIDGEVDLIFVPYASADVLQEAQDAGVELRFQKIAAEALIFITPKENSAQNITREQVRDIYLNYGITNWRDLGGEDRELIPLCRNADSGSQSQMDNLVLENEPMHPDIQKNYVELTMEGMLELTAFYHYGGLGGEPINGYALGYTLFSYMNNMAAVVEAPSMLKTLTFNGIEPTVQSIADGSYPLSDGYYAVTRADLPEESGAHAIISWLQSPDGASMIEDIGLIPLGAQ